jgi:O-antigen/teichoic acid export membrane protein
MRENHDPGNQPKRGLGMSTARIYARNLAANWFGQAAGLVVLFFLSPFVVHTLGKTEYGIWSLLNVFTGYLGVFDLGVRASTGRHIILYLGRGDHERVGETLRTGLAFFSLVSLLILAVAVGLGFAFPLLFPSAPPEYFEVVRLLLPLLALNVWLSAIGGAFASILAAHDRFDLSQGIDVAVLIVRTIATVAVLLTGQGIVGLTLVTVGASALAAVGAWCLAHRIYPRLRVWPLTMSRERLRELLGYGVAAFLGSVAINILGQTDLLLVGILFSVQAVAVYSVGAMLVWYTSPFVVHISGTIFPAIQRDVATGDLNSVRWTYLRLVMISLVFGLPMYLGFAIFGDSFINLWMGREFSEAAIVIIILSASKLILLVPTGAWNLLYATGNVWFTTVVTMVEAILKLALALVFVMALGWGLAGVAAGTLVAVLLARGVLLPWYAHRRIGLTNRTFAARAVVPGLLCGTAFAGWCILVRLVVPGDTWLLFAAQVALALLGYTPLALWLLVSKSDRTRVWRLFGAPATGKA